MTMNKLLLLLLIINSTLSAKTLEFGNNELLNLASNGEQLNPGEGYLYLSLENYDLIRNFYIKPKITGEIIRFKSVERGFHHALIKLKEGTYTWDKFNYKVHTPGKNNEQSISFDYLKHDNSFKVEAGVVNYPGSWVTRLIFLKDNYISLNIHSENQSSMEYARFKKLFADFSKQYEFKFQGEYRDDYLTYLNNISKNSKNDNEKIEYYNADNGVDSEIKLYPQIKNYLKDGNQSIGKLNPSGQFLFYTSVENGKTKIKVLNMSSFVAVVIFEEELYKGSYFSEVKWIDDDSIYYQLKYLGQIITKVVHLEFNNKNEIIDSVHLAIKEDGNLIDPLLKQENMMFFSKTYAYNFDEPGLFKVDTTSNRSIKKTLKKKYKGVQNIDNDIYWLTDNNSEIRFLISKEVNEDSKKTSYHYWFKQNTAYWKKINTFKSLDNLIIPELISDNGQFFYVITNEFSDKRSIHKYSTNDFSHMGLFFENNDTDIIKIKTDPESNKIIGYSHIHNGFNKTEYFESNNDIIESLNNKYKGTNFYSLQHNLKSKTVLVFGQNQYSKGSWSIYNEETKQLLKLFEVNPEYSKLKKGIFQHLNITTKDGLDVEGFLVVPENINEVKAPLIVIPHGGPIGVRDYAYNDSVQHFLASQGFASLKVNYRGSGGYGKHFKESGKQQWGKKIESDINEMVDYSLKKYNLSANKICAMGSSYGGYSSVMLSILYPDRYKCAVSYAGVMDIPLMFSSSRYKFDTSVDEKMKEIVGDPNKNYEQLIKTSPLYITDKIKNPILLLHGDLDSRVYIEHSLRMKEIADLINIDINLTVLENEKHSLYYLNSNIVHIARSLNFIQKHLSN